jgi:Aldehyde dehydrogenase family
VVVRGQHLRRAGPVAVVYKVSTDDEAVQLANGVDFGLGAVCSTDEERAIKVAEQLEVTRAAANPAARLCGSRPICARTGQLGARFGRSELYREMDSEPRAQVRILPGALDRTLHRTHADGGAAH